MYLDIMYLECILNCILTCIFAYSTMLLFHAPGTPEEMVCPGGELAFVTQMVKDSLQLQGRIHWYTSMVGKKATLKQLRRLLHDSKVTALRSTEFVQVGFSCTVSAYLPWVDVTETR